MKPLDISELQKDIERLLPEYGLAMKSKPKFYVSTDIITEAEYGDADILRDVCEIQCMIFAKRIGSPEIHIKHPY